MLVLNERNGVEITASFTAADNAPVVPAEVRWRLDCDASGAVLQDWTTATLEQTLDGTTLTEAFVTIKVPGSLNTMQTTSASEKKAILIVADPDTDREYSEVFEYRIRSLGKRR